MATNIRAEVIRVARAEVGYQRKSNRWNKYADELYPTVQRQPYCGVGAAWAIYKAGVDVRGVVWMPYVPYIENWARKNGAWKTSGQKDGDLVVFDWGGDGLADHVGISWRDEKAKGYRSIEFNTSGSSAGSQSNGGGVHVRYRGRKSIRGWVDLDKLVAAAGAKTVHVKAEDKASGAITVDGRIGRKTVQELQQRLKHINSKLAVDGRAGEATWKVLQACLGTFVDGVVDHQSYKATELGNGIVPGKNWDYDGRGAKGSNMVRALQRKLGIEADGVWGEGTTRALQKAMNADQNLFTKKL